ncbi:hypothetical protein O6H91_Y546200 [Diphasiastrum complanatum]|nr:hypothetical protein O6H91_Y546200 [Diphasiastrum complanatum]
MAALDSLGSLEQSLRETLQKGTADNEKRQRVAEIQKQVWEKKRQSSTVEENVVRSASNGNYARQNTDDAKATEKSLKAKEEEIEKRKLEVKVKVQAQLTRVEHEARQLDDLRRVRLWNALSLCLFFSFFDVSRKKEKHILSMAGLIFDLY